MKTAQVNGNTIVIKDVENLKLNGRKGAIVKVLGCGLCGSDIVKFKQKIVNDGAVLGHEIVAIIEEINSETKFQIKDKIVTSHHIPCFECTYCKHENYSMCQHFKETNIIPGGFSEMLYLSDEHLKFVAQKLPTDINDEEASFYEPLACCIRAIKRCNLHKEDKVLVIGLGSIGLIMAEALAAFGYKVFGCDILENRILLSTNKGIESFNSSNIETFEQIIKEKTQQYGVDAIFMTSGADKAIEIALRSIKQGGKILVFSSTPNNFGYANNDIYYKELTILGSYSPSPTDLKDAFELLINKKIDVKGLTTTYPLENIQEAFDDTMCNKIFKAYIKIN